MTEPTTTNCGLIVPLTGDLVGTWGSAALNPDFSAIDGYIAGVQIISASNAPITLTSPAGFTPTPSGGPTQAQNAVIRFTGTLTSSVQVTLPLPGPIVVENLTTGNFVLSFRAVGSGQVVAVDQGEIQTVYNDGTNVRFVNLGSRIGHTEIWAGLSAMPAWVSACTVPPYLLCDGSIYNFTTYPYLGKRLGSAFGGNGISTFGVPDLRGRMALPYDGTGSRITSAGSGINGQVLGASADNQSVTLNASQIPTINSSTGGPIISSPVGRGNVPGTNGGIATEPAPSSGGNNVPYSNAGAGDWTSVNQFSTGSAVSSTSTNTGGGSHSNVQPSQVTGIAVIRAA